MLERTQKRNPFSDILLVLILFFVSGNPLMSFLGDLGYLYVLVVLAVVVKLDRIKKIYWNQAKYWLLIYVMVFVVQMFTVKEVSLLGDANHICKFLVGFLIVAYLGGRFPVAYVRAMSILCIISLVGYLCTLTLGDLPFSIHVNRYCSWVLYNGIETQYNYGDEFPRNSGMFWEPGAFQGYINLAILLLGQGTGGFKNNKGQLVVLSIALLSTQSTTGYIVFGVIIGYYIIISKVSVFWKSSFVVLFVLGIYYASSLEFMSEKLSTQIEEVQDMSVESDMRINHARFSAATFDWYYIKKRPLFGGGLLLDAKYYEHKGFDLDGLGNGLTGAIASMGMIYMALLLWNVYRNGSRMRGFSIVLIVFMTCTLFGEAFLNFPLYLAMPFIALTTKSKENEIYRSTSCGAQPEGENVGVLA